MDILYNAPENALLYTRTTQYHIIKNILESIHSFLPDGNFKITSEGIMLQNMDKHRNSMICIVLDRFEHHFCKHTFYIGLSLKRFLEGMRHINGDMLVLYIRDSDTDEQRGLEVYIHENELIHTFTLPLYRSTVEEYEFEDFQKASRVFSIPNNSFQRLIKKTSNLGADKMHANGKACYIRCEDDMVIIGTKGKEGDHITSFIPPNPGKNSMRWCFQNLDTDPENFTNFYYTRYLEKFCKNQLDDRVLVYLRKDYVMYLRYMLGDLGYITFMISPIPSDEIDASFMSSLPSQSLEMSIRREYKAPEKKRRARSAGPPLPSKKIRQEEEDDFTPPQYPRPAI